MGRRGVGVGVEVGVGGWVAISLRWGWGGEMGGVGGVVGVVGVWRVWSCEGEGCVVGRARWSEGLWVRLNGCWCCFGLVWFGLVWFGDSTRTRVREWMDRVVVIVGEERRVELGGMVWKKRVAERGSSDRMSE